MCNKKAILQKKFFSINCLFHLCVDTWNVKNIYLVKSIYSMMIIVQITCFIQKECQLQTDWAGSKGESKREWEKQIKSVGSNVWLRNENGVGWENDHWWDTSLECLISNPFKDKQIVNQKQGEKYLFWVVIFLWINCTMTFCSSYNYISPHIFSNH